MAMLIESVAHHRFDDTEHGFRRLLAQPAEFSACRSLKPMCHLLHRRCRGWRRFGGGSKNPVSRLIARKLFMASNALKAQK
jgi:hypothetical protein